MGEEIKTGEIMRFDPDRGYGFIRPDSGGPDLFMHVSELARNVDPQVIRPRLRVAFEEGYSEKGPKAVRVSVLGSNSTAARLDVPAPATVASWRALWQEVSDAAFEQMLVQARANGWVQD